MSDILPYEEISRIIDEISSGGKIVYIDGREVYPTAVLIKHCSLSDRMYSDVVYRSSYERAIQEGFLTTDQLVSIIRKRGLFTEADEKEIEKLRNQIEAQQRVLDKTTQIPARRERIINIIKTIEDKISNILYKKEIYLDNSAERRAQEEKFLFLLWKGSFDPHTNELLWPTKEEFDNERDINYRQNLFIKYISFYYGMELSVVRQVARHNLWRIRYISSLKTGGDLFGRAISEYTVDQLSLAYWSQFYQSIYEMMPDEKPGESIIEDDDALDAFMKNYFEEKSREDAASREKKAGKGKSSAWDHNEVIVTGSHPLSKDIKYSKPKKSGENRNKVAVIDRGQKVEKQG